MSHDPLRADAFSGGGFQSILELWVSERRQTKRDQGSEREGGGKTERERERDRDSERERQWERSGDEMERARIWKRERERRVETRWSGALVCNFAGAIGPYKSLLVCHWGLLTVTILPYFLPFFAMNCYLSAFWLLSAIIRCWTPFVAAIQCQECPKGPYGIKNTTGSKSLQR